MSPNSTQTLFDYLKTQEEDKMCTSVSIYCQKGWPERKNEIATELRPYWNARSELTVDKNSLLLYQKRIVVPKSLQRNTWEDPLRAPGSTKVQTMSKHSRLVAWTFTRNGKHGSTVHTMLPLGNSTWSRQSYIPDSSWQKIGTDLLDERAH